LLFAYAGPFDLAARKLLKTVDNTVTQSSNGAPLVPEFDLGISNNFYLAARDTEKVYRIDTKTLRVTAEWPTPHSRCRPTHGDQNLACH
jgi:hypothetical protein